MSFCSFASLVGGACGPSLENPEVDKFVYVKDCDREVKAHLKLCEILTNVEQPKTISCIIDISLIIVIFF